MCLQGLWKYHTTKSLILSLTPLLLATNLACLQIIPPHSNCSFSYFNSQPLSKPGFLSHHLPWLQKTFDKVSHSELLLKLWMAGYTGNLWMWLKAYLSKSQQCVSINTISSSLSYSNWVFLREVFLDLCSSLYSVTYSETLLFVIDTKSLLSINSFSNTPNLQNDLDTTGACGDGGSMTTKCTESI